MESTGRESWRDRQLELVLDYRVYIYMKHIKSLFVVLVKDIRTS